jgi:hypothetical protein
LGGGAESGISHFEFLSVGIAIVVSFGVIRLLDGASHAVGRTRRYWPHLMWVALKLLQHFNIWWTLWTRREASWSYAGFLAQLMPPLVLYLQATALAPPSPEGIESWRDHFYSVRRRFFGLNIAFACANPLADFAVGGSGMSLVTPAGIIAISVVGILSDSHRVQTALALFALLGNLLLVALFTYNPAASPFG